MSNHLPRRRPVMVLTLAGLLAAVVGPAVPASAGSESHGEQDLRARTGGSVQFARRPGSKRLSLIGTRPGHPVARPEQISAGQSSSSAAGHWAARYGALFGVPDAAHGLSVARADRVPHGSVVRLQQHVGSLPVVGAQLVVTLDDDNRLLSMSGAALSGRPASTTPRVGVLAAQRIAVERTRRDGGRHLLPDAPTLSVLDLGLLGGGPSLSGPALVWDLTVTSLDRRTRHEVFVDAERGSVLLDLDRNDHALDRVVCNAGNNPDADTACPSAAPGVTQVGTEASPPAAPVDGGDADAYDAFRFSGAVYDFYKDVLGRDSLDGKGQRLSSTVHFCPAAECPGYQNAFWDGTEMVYGDGFASALDAVGHELTHGVTERTSNLFSYYQSGAINESMSDIMGELVQQLKGPSLNTPGTTDVYDTSGTRDWLVGEYLPGGDLIRNMADPTKDNPSYTDSTGVTVPASPDPDSMRSPYYGRGSAASGSGDRGDVHANDGVGNKAAWLIAHGGSLNGVTVPGLRGTTTQEKLVKTAHLYYRLDQTMTSGSAYADVAVLLPQSCDNQVGTAYALPGGGTTALTGADCNTVRAAVAATQMTQQPRYADAALRTPAPFCPDERYRTTVAVSTFEGTNPIGHSYTRGQAGTDSAGGRSFGQWWWSEQALNPDYGPTVFAPVYATSGKGALYGDDADPSLGDNPDTPYDRQDSFIRTGSLIGGTGTYLRFRSAWEFEYESDGTSTVYPDGGRVEYTVDGGSHWYDAGAPSPVASRAMLVSGGYNGTVTDLSDPTYVDRNPLRGRRAFVGSSHGWTSSRLDLGAVNGKTVQVRWRIGADNTIGALGWYLDDLTTFRCNPTSLGLTAPTSRTYGTAATVKAVLVRAGTSTSLPRRSLQLYSRRHGTSAWATVGGAKTTSSAGTASWAVAPSTYTDYQARFAGVTKATSSVPLSPTTSGVRTVGVKVLLSKTVSSTTLTLGHSFRTTGKVTPAHRGTAMRLQRYSSGAWRTVVTRALTTSSTYALSFKPGVRGTYAYRVLFVGDRDHVATLTASFRVAVS